MVLGIDTSGIVCSVALVDNGKVISEFSTNNKKTHSAILVPMIDKMLEVAEVLADDITLFAVSNGPGSFTGIRIGAATASGFGLALNKPVIGVSALEALSYNLHDSKCLVCPIMDARRKEVYTGLYNYKNNNENSVGKVVIPPKATSLEFLINELNEINKPVVFLGDAVSVYKNDIIDNSQFEYSFATENNNLQRASSVAILGESMFKKDTNVKELKIEYLRRPQAERERLGL